MAAELAGLISLTQLQKLVQSQYHNIPPSQMFMNNKTNHDAGEQQQEGEEEEDEESNWEVKAFEEDTNNAMGTTWPPRSYTCTFCRREFRSAQALGGHMNVHRRDRARLHQSHPYLPHTTAAASPTSPLIIPTQDFMPNGGLCLFYSLPQNPNYSIGGTSSKLISDILPSRSVPHINFPVAVNHDGYNPNHGSINHGHGGREEIDLELRLGRAWP